MAFECPIIYAPLKKGRGTYKRAKLKLTVAHINYVTVTWFLSAAKIIKIVSVSKYMDLTVFKVKPHMIEILNHYYHDYRNDKKNY